MTDTNKCNSCFRKAIWFHYPTESYFCMYHIPETGKKHNLKQKEEWDKFNKQEQVLWSLGY